MARQHSVIIAKSQGKNGLERAARDHLAQLSSQNKLTSKFSCVDWDLVQSGFPEVNCSYVGSRMKCVE